MSPQAGLVQALADAILTETEYQDPQPLNKATKNLYTEMDHLGEWTGPQPPADDPAAELKDLEKQAVSRIQAAIYGKPGEAFSEALAPPIEPGYATHPLRKSALAFSGGDDSIVLLNLVNRALEMEDRPTIIWTNTGMEYPETQLFIEHQAQGYGMDIRIARPARTPLQQFTTTGWPMLGKMAARTWSQTHPTEGFKINCSECCRAMKINPARKLTRNLGARLQFTGQRGAMDDQARGLRAHKDGVQVFQLRGQILIANPLTGWTDADIAGYIKKYDLARHPAKARGAKTIGCLFCGGGSQYSNSGFRVLQQTEPKAWQKFMVTWGAGEIILALKYNTDLETTRAALAIIHPEPLAHLAITRPWVFDFTRLNPLKGYLK